MSDILFKGQFVELAIVVFIQAHIDEHEAVIFAPCMIAQLFGLILLHREKTLLKHVLELPGSAPPYECMTDHLADRQRHTIPALGQDEHR